MIKGLKIYVYILSMQDLIIKLFLKRSVLHLVQSRNECRSVESTLSTPLRTTLDQVLTTLQLLRNTEKKLRLFFLILAIQASLTQNIEGLSQILTPKNGRLIRLIRSGGRHA